VLGGSRPINALLPNGVIGITVGTILSGPTSLDAHGMEEVMSLDESFFGELFEAYPTTEEAIDAASAEIMKLTQKDKEEARKADYLLVRLLLQLIASGMIADPKKCAEHYFVVNRAAFGVPTLLDQVKAQFGQ
jgi:hypothetical protein